ncbi:PadR family transcriptional regulator [Candidatus Woesearchaeota archaeon]|nr:PadR family transcriptional regulator [Candidatus Woesearchaeota archaeon]
MQPPKHLELKGFLSFQILHELSIKKLCGDELAVAIGLKKGSKLTPGTIYPALKFLRKKKLIQHKRCGRKKCYTLTENGVKEYNILKKTFKKIFSKLLK